MDRKMDIWMTNVKAYYPITIMWKVLKSDTHHANNFFTYSFQGSN